MSWTGHIFRRRLIDQEFLHHTEWKRRMGIAGLIGIGGIISLPLGVFVIIPHCISAVAGPSSLLGLLIAFIVLLISGLHLAELASAMPKSCLLYHFTYASCGELPAFLVAWLSLCDYTVAIVTVARAWSDHVNILFNGVIMHYLRGGPIDKDAWFFGLNHFDYGALMVIVGAVAIMCCSLRVAGTVSAILFILSLLTITSSMIVGCFFANPTRWSRFGFFEHGISGMLHSASFMLVAFAGVEALTFALDEAHQPRRRLPRLLPPAITSLALFFFFVTLTATLAVDFEAVAKANFLLPDMFQPLNAPAARYMVSVGSVCGLTGTCIALFLPASRILVGLAEDRLVPGSGTWSKRNSKRGAPYMAIFLIAMASSSLLFVAKSSIFDMVTVNLPLRMLLMACLVYHQHFRAEPVVGLASETSHYDHFGKKYRITSSHSLSNSVDMVDCCTETGTEENETDENLDDSDTSGEAMYYAKYEADKLQRQLERQQKRQYHEKSPLFTKSNGLNCPAAKSPPHDPAKDEQDPTAVAVIDAHCEQCPLKRKHNYDHNCVGSPCTPMDDDSLHEVTNGRSTRRIHLYEAHIPEIPYFGQFNGNAARSASPVDQGLHSKRALRVLYVYMVLCSVFGMAFIAQQNDTVPPLQVLYACIALFALLGIIGLTVIAVRLKTNDWLSRRKHKAIGFPYLSLLAIFLIVLCICSTPLAIFWKTCAWILLGVLIYFAYGYAHSRARTNGTTVTVLGNRNVEQFDPIISNSDNSLMFTVDSIVTLRG